MVNYAGASMALFYASLNVALLLYNKYVFFRFNYIHIEPLVGIQLLLTAGLCYTLKKTGVTHFPDISWPIVKQNFPIAITYTLNSVFALLALSHLSMAMYSTLKRTSIFVVMCLNYYFLEKPSSSYVRAYAILVAVGAIVAGSTDLEFDVIGYIFSASSISMKALNLILVAKAKKARSPDVPPLGSWGVIFYSSLLAAPFMICLSLVTTDWEGLRNFDYEQPGFKLSMFIFICEGVILQVIVYWTVALTSALTTSVTANLKLPLVSAAAMIVWGEYQENPYFNMGVLMSSVGGVSYSLQVILETFHAEWVLQSKGATKDVERGKEGVDDLLGKKSEYESEYEEEDTLKVGFE